MSALTIPDTPPEGIAFTQPYLEAGQVILALVNETTINGAADIQPGTAVGVLADSPGSDAAAALGIAASEDVYKRQTQGGIGMRRFMGREGLGNPTREAEAQVAKMTAMIEEVAPGAADVPVLPVIVFTTPNLDNLDVKESRIPATHSAKLSAVLRQQTLALKPLPKADYDALRAAFDAKAAHLIEETVNADAE